MKSILFLFVLTTFHFACQSQSSFSPILKEVIGGNLSKIKQHITSGQDINAHHKPGYTLLCGSVKSNQIEIVKYLIEEGADLNKLSNQKTPLMYAAKYGRLTIAKLLIEKGANQNKVSPNGKSALDYAIKYKRPELIEFLKRIDQQ